MFATILKELRVESRVSRKEMAEMLGITVQAYGNYETGKREPDYRTLIQFANYFHVTTDFLLGRRIKEYSTPKDEFFFIKKGQLRREDMQAVKEYIGFLRYKAEMEEKIDNKI